MTSVFVNLPAESYEVVVEAGSLASLGSRARRVAPHAKAMLALDANIAKTHGEAARRSLADAGYAVTTIELVAEESDKTLPAVRRVYDAMLDARLERASPVIAVGGGIVGDVAGYAAATYLRGVPLIHVPTTLLAMVDASIGGKTGVNIEIPSHAGSPASSSRENLGKNLIGAFWQPKLVLADPLVLRTLGARDLHCGIAECVKHGMIANLDLLTFLADQLPQIEALDRQALETLVGWSAGIKASIVEIDERESGRRALLNLGHTFAHAIEPIPSLDLRHGEAVSIGLAAACAVSVERGMMTEDERRSVLDLLGLHQLPTRIPRVISPPPVELLMHAMTFDKKVADGRLRLVLPRGLGDAEIDGDVPISMVERAWREVGAA